MVAGPTASGKTTLCNAVIQEIAQQFPDERLLILEDTLELQYTSRDFLRLRTPEAPRVLLVVYDLNGKEIDRLHDGPMQAGTHRVMWDATNLPSGVYFYRLQAGDFSQTKPMTLLK